MIDYTRFNLRPLSLFEVQKCETDVELNETQT
jgi:hypothetical protein